MADVKGSGSRHSFALVSLGCPKAQVDSEVILGGMVSSGFLLCEDPSKAEVIIVNTCCFIEEATRESREAIDRAVSAKASGSVKCVLVYGCMPQRFKEGLLRENRGVDAVIGLNERDSLPSVVLRLLEKASSRILMACDLPRGTPHDRPRLRFGPRHYAYMRITEGCSNNCAYCTIPFMRGALRSKPVDELVAEASELADDGVVELMLVAQDTAAFGKDSCPDGRLPELVNRISEVKGIKWIRILYAHPAHVNEGIVDLLAGNEKVVKYMDMPIQHASDRILKMMGRGTDKASLMRLLDLLRNKVEGIVIRTTAMVGFPGETDEDFEQLVRFVEDVEFDRLGAFRYSREEGTAAYGFPDHLPEKVKLERYRILLEKQQEIAFRKNLALAGKTVEVIVDGSSDVRGYSHVGRTYGDAPDIDNRVFFEDSGLPLGVVLDAVVTGASGYDLTARVKQGRWKQ